MTGAGGPVVAGGRDKSRPYDGRNDQAIEAGDSSLRGSRASPVGAMNRAPTMDATIRLSRREILRYAQNDRGRRACRRRWAR